MFFLFTTDYPVCSDDEYQCFNSKCIPKNQRCDSINQCDDDEYRCGKLSTYSYNLNTRFNDINDFLYP